MKHPFMIGDRVYVADVEHRLPVTFVTEDTVTVRLDDGTDYVATPGKFSYSPWPAPNHKRPLNDGPVLFVLDGGRTIFYGVITDGELVRQRWVDGIIEKAETIMSNFTIIKRF